MVTFLRMRSRSLFGIIGDVFVRHNDPAGIRLEKSHNVLQRDGFADAAAPQDADRLSRHAHRS